MLNIQVISSSEKPQKGLILEQCLNGARLIMLMHAGRTR